MSRFLPRRYFIEKSGYPKLTLAPVAGPLAANIARHEGVQEVGFRKWFETMWQRSDYTEPPEDIPTEREYWEKWC